MLAENAIKNRGETLNPQKGVSSVFCTSLRSNSSQSSFNLNHILYRYFVNFKKKMQKYLTFIIKYAILKKNQIGLRKILNPSLGGLRVIFKKTRTSLWWRQWFVTTSEFSKQKVAGRLK